MNDLVGMDSHSPSPNRREGLLWSVLHILLGGLALNSQRGSVRLYGLYYVICSKTSVRLMG